MAMAPWAVFNASTTAALTVTLDEPVTLGTLVLGSGTPGVGYTLSGGGSNTLTFSNTGNSAPAEISGNDGAHFIDAPVILASNLVVTSTILESLDAQLWHCQQHHGQRQPFVADHERKQRNIDFERFGQRYRRHVRDCRHADLDERERHRRRHELDRRQPRRSRR